MTHNTLSGLIDNYLQNGDRFAVRRTRSDWWGPVSPVITELARETARIIDRYTGNKLVTGSQVLIFPADGTPKQVVTLTADGWKTGDILT